MTGIQHIISVNDTVALYINFPSSLFHEDIFFFSNLKGKLFLIALDNRKR